MGRLEVTTTSIWVCSTRANVVVQDKIENLKRWTKAKKIPHMFAAGEQCRTKGTVIWPGSERR